MARCPHFDSHTPSAYVQNAVRIISTVFECLKNRYNLYMTAVLFVILIWPNDISISHWTISFCLITVLAHQLEVCRIVRSPFNNTPGCSSTPLGCAPFRNQLLPYFSTVSVVPSAFFIMAIGEKPNRPLNLVVILLIQLQSHIWYRFISSQFLCYIGLIVASIKSISHCVSAYFS